MRKIVLFFLASSLSLSCFAAQKTDDNTMDFTNIEVSNLIHANKEFFVGGGLAMNWLNYGQTANQIYYTPYSYYDAYTNNGSATTPSFSINGGYRWASEMVYTLGLRYEHILSKEIDGNVLVLNNPTFAYNNSFDTGSNVFMLFGKLDITRLWSMSPYVSLGLGVSSNNFEGYTESPANTPSVARNVNFDSTSAFNFAYDFGFGLDFRIRKNYLISIGYDYIDLGSVKSGSGSYNNITNTNNSLNFGKLTASRILAQIDYLFK